MPVVENAVVSIVACFFLFLAFNFLFESLQ